MQKDKKDYITPTLTVVSFRAEHGFADSSWDGWKASNQKLKELDENLMSEIEAGDNWYSQPVAGYFENTGESQDLSGGWGSDATNSWF